MFTVIVVIQDLTLIIVNIAMTVKLLLMIVVENILNITFKE